MAIDQIQLLASIFSLIFVAISTIVGVRVALKYFKTKNRTLLWVGFAWILMVSPWWPSAIAGIVALITGHGLDLATYIFLGNFLVPLFIFFLIAAFTELYFHEKQKIILLIFAIIGIVFEIYFLTYLIIDPNLHGELQGLVDIEYRGVLRYYLVLNILLTCVVGVLIGFNSLRSDEPTIKLRGKFLLTAFITWTVGAIADASVPLSIITLPIIRIILISSAIFFYLGFILPSFLKNRVTK